MCENASTERSTDCSFRDPLVGSSLQLPRITLPKFSGKFTEWENFRGIFESLVASNESLSNTQKLHYLKASVTDDAMLLINNINISDANYEAAWQRLVDEYENLYVHEHIRAFSDLPVMKSETASELKRLRDTAAASVSALKILGRSVDQWDDFLVYILAQKFSPRTRNEWNLKRGSSRECPTYTEIHEFMTLRVRGLTDYSKLRDNGSNVSPATKARSSVHNVSVVKCVHCSGNHNLHKCNEFLAKSVEQRALLVSQLKGCFNCLRKGHLLKNCPSKGRCGQCGRSHHSLLHRDNPAPASVSGETGAASSAPTGAPSAAAPPISSCVPTATVQTVSASMRDVPDVLLATAWVTLRTAEGRAFKMRALLDQGSTFSFISESLCQLLRTKRHRASLRVQCFGKKYSGVAKSLVSLKLEPCDDQGTSFPLTGYVYQSITSYAVSRARPIESWPHLRGLPLADSDPTSSHPIHVLIGADLYGSLLLSDLRQGPIGTPTAQLTVFGWILSGPAGSTHGSAASAPVFHCVSALDTNELLRKFWEDEEVPTRSLSSEEDASCEQHFVSMHSRTPQ